MFLVKFCKILLLMSKSLVDVEVDVEVVCVPLEELVEVVPTLVVEVVFPFKSYLQTGQVLCVENHLNISLLLKICPQLFILVTVVPSIKGVLAIGQTLKLLLLVSLHIKLVVCP